jgi:hypothetical protein
MSGANLYDPPRFDTALRRRPTGRAVRMTAGILFTLLGLHLVIRVLAITNAIAADLLILGIHEHVDFEQVRIDNAVHMRRLGLLRELRKTSWWLLVPAWLIWAGCCNRLARDRGLALYYGPLGTTLWWFVPIANLVLPLRVTAEQWRASQAPEPGAWQTVGVSWVVVAWWISLLAMLVARVAVFATGLDLYADADADAYPDADPYAAFEALRVLLRRDVVQHALAILTASLALVIVSQISTGLRRDLD